MIFYEIIREKGNNTFHVMQNLYIIALECLKHHSLILACR